MFEVVSEKSSRSWLKNRDFKLCRSIQQLREYVFNATTVEVSEDWETTSLNPEKARPVGLGVSTDPKHGLYCPVGHFVGSEHNLPLEEVKQVIIDIDAKYPNWWWYHGYDGECMLNWWKLELSNWNDAMFAVYLENPNVNVYGLKDSSMRLLGIDMITFEEVTKGRNFAELDPSDQATIDYGCSDVAIALELKRLPNVTRAISNDPKWGQKFIYDLERKVAPCVREGERNRCWIDKDRLILLQEQTRTKVRNLEHEIHELAGGEFNIGSAKVLGNKLLELGVPIKERTGKSGQVDTQQETIARYSRHHPIIEKLLMWKKLATQCRNYIDKLAQGVDVLGPFVKFPFSHIGVPTGRMKAGGEGKGQMAYNKGVIDLNVQSFPDAKKEPYLPNIRAALVANDPRQKDRDFLWVSIDYGQLQARIAANIFREPAWIKAFNEGVDLHMMNARLAYRDNTITKDHPKRDKGKTLTYAVLFGGSEYTVRDSANIPLEEAKLLVDGFFGGAPKLKEGIDSFIRMAQAQKFVKTPFGRIRPLNEFYPDKPFRSLSRVERRVWFKGDREAINSPIQGGEADIFKIACVKIRKLINERNWQNDVKVVLFEHDEIDFRIRRSMLEQIVPELRKAMEFEVKGWPVPLVTEAEVGYTENSNWGEMLPYETYIQGDAAINEWLIKKKKKTIDADEDMSSELQEEQEAIEESFDAWR